MSREKKKGKGRLILLLLIIFALIYAIATKVYSDYKNYDAVLDENSVQSISVTIPAGSSTGRIAQILLENGIIGDARRFKLKARLNGMDGSFQAGDYLLSPSMSTSEIMNALQDAKKETVRFTIPEGYTIVKTAEKLAEEGLISSPEDFYAACEEEYDYWFLKGVDVPADPTGKLSAKGNRLEGFLFPETYEVYKGATPRQIIERMLGQFDRVFTGLYEESGKSLNGLSLQEFVTLASLVERESGVDEDRPLVSSVIYNRLESGMKLQIDACVLYAMGTWKDRVYLSDLEIDSPYNTYMYGGLPAGPIASAGEKSLRAALYPANTNYIYYVLKGDGSGAHNFAEDYDTFLKYKDEYIKSLGN